MTQTHQIAADPRLKAREIVHLFVSGVVDCILQTAKEITRFIDEDPANRELLLEESGGIMNPQLISTLEKVGRGQLHPQLVVASSPGMERLKRLPMSLQEKFLKKPLPVLIVNGEGRVDHILVELNALTARQAAQVFSSDDVRDLGAQRAWLEDERMAQELLAF